MRIQRVVWAVVGVMSLVATSAMAQSFNQSSASANATARIIAPISITNSTALNFGDIVPSGVTGTVVVSAASARTNTGGATLGSGASVSAATFAVGGQAGATYAITLPTSVTITSGANNMTVNAFTSSPSSTGLIPGGGGTQTLTVGATLNVGANQATGTYAGSFNVTVAYN